MPGPKEFAMTLQDVSDLLADAPSLEVGKRRELRSANATFARACGRAQSEIIADAPHINHLLKKAGWQRLGITGPTWANVQSRVRTALQIAGVDIVKRRNFKLSPEWETLIEPLPFKKRQDLGRFAGFCTLRKIAPSHVTGAVFQEFLRFNHEQIIQRDARERWQAARRAWNHLAGMAPELGLPVIPNTLPPRWRGLTENELPETLRADLDSLRRWLSTVDPLDEWERQALKSATVSNYAGNLRRYVSHLVEMGASLDELTSLTSILDCDVVKGFFRSQIDKRGTSRAELKERATQPCMHILQH